MNYAVIENGKVINIVVAEADYAASQGWIDATGACIGDDYIDGAFVRPEPDLALLSETIRNERNKLLVRSDWTQVADAPVDKTAWGAYRQALRDIPTQVGFPLDIQWPVEP